MKVSAGIVFKLNELHEKVNDVHAHCHSGSQYGRTIAIKNFSLLGEKMNFMLRFLFYLFLKLMCE